MEDWDQETLEKAIARASVLGVALLPGVAFDWRVPHLLACIPLPLLQCSRDVGCCGRVAGQAIRSLPTMPALRRRRPRCVQRSTQLRTRTGPPRSSASSFWRRWRR